jgi:hypothetical protein
MVVVLRLHEAVGRLGSRADDDPGAVAGEPMKRDEAPIADLSAAAEELGLRSGARADPAATRIGAPLVRSSQALPCRCGVSRLAR